MTSIYEYQEQVELVGKVVIEPKLIDGDDCLIQVRWQGGFDGGYDFYDIIMRKRKPWWIKPGVVVRAIGILKGRTLLADGCWKYKPRRSRSAIGD